MTHIRKYSYDIDPHPLCESILVTNKNEGLKHRADEGIIAVIWERNLGSEFYDAAVNATKEFSDRFNKIASDLSACDTFKEYERLFPQYDLSNSHPLARQLLADAELFTFEDGAHYSFSAAKNDDYDFHYDIGPRYRKLCTYLGTKENLRSGTFIVAAIIQPQDVKRAYRPGGNPTKLDNQFILTRYTKQIFALKIGDVLAMNGIKDLIYDLENVSDEDIAASVSNHALAHSVNPTQENEPRSTMVWGY